MKKRNTNKENSFKRKNEFLDETIAAKKGECSGVYIFTRYNVIIKKTLNDVLTLTSIVIASLITLLTFVCIVFYSQPKIEITSAVGLFLLVFVLVCVFISFYTIPKVTFTILKKTVKYVNEKILKEIHN